MTGAALAFTSRSVKSSPNLVFVFPDQMRGQAMGFLKDDPVITPNLDRFATQGVVFTHAVSNYPVCSPYRAMLFTGKYPHSNKVLANCNSNGAKHGYELQESDRCFSDVLKTAGYSLGYIGKWHLDSPYKPYVDTSNNSEKFAWNEWCPPHRRHGFDFWYAYGTYDHHFEPQYWTTHSIRDKRVKVKQWSPEHEADQAISYIKNKDKKFRDPDKPFALFVSMNPPHTPYSYVPKKYLEYYKDKTPEQLIVRPSVNLKEKTKCAEMARKQIKNYFAQITGVDEQFGRILKAIEEQGIRNNTIVVFTSDHGNCLGCHEKVTKNVHYEESMRVPFILRYPKRIPPKRDDLLISTPDIFPTLLHLMGHGALIPNGVEGENHGELLLTGKGERPASQLYLWIPYGEPAYGRRGVRTHGHTLMISKKKGKPETKMLHDNIKDPYQLKNIADSRPDIVKELYEKELIPWLKKTRDPWLES